MKGLNDYAERQRTKAITETKQPKLAAGVYQDPLDWNQVLWSEAKVAVALDIASGIGVKRMRAERGASYLHSVRAEISTELQSELMGEQPTVLPMANVIYRFAYFTGEIKYQIDHKNL